MLLPKCFTKRCSSLSVKKNRIELKQNLEKVFAVSISLKNSSNVDARLLDIIKDRDLVPFSQLLDNIKFSIPQCNCRRDQFLFTAKQVLVSRLLLR